jgi:hypothetical protein
VKQFWKGVWHFLGHPYEREPVLDPNAVFVQGVLRVFAEARIHDELLWTVDPHGQVVFMANVSDTFDWGSADGEAILPRHLRELEKAYADLKALETAEGASYPTSYTKYTAMLYAARRRQCRPMKRAYPEHARIAALLDACGGSRG